MSTRTTIIEGMATALWMYACDGRGKPEPEALTKAANDLADLYENANDMSLQAMQESMLRAPEDPLEFGEMLTKLAIGARIIAPARGRVASALETRTGSAIKLARFQCELVGDRLIWSGDVGSDDGGPAPGLGPYSSRANPAGGPRRAGERSRFRETQRGHGRTTPMLPPVAQPLSRGKWDDEFYRAQVKHGVHADMPGIEGAPDTEAMWRRGMTPDAAARTLLHHAQRPRRNPDDRQFVTDESSRSYSLAQMIAANAEDVELCDRLRAMRPGDKIWTGGGAAASGWVKCVPFDPDDPPEGQEDPARREARRAMRRRNPARSVAEVRELLNLRRPKDKCSKDCPGWIVSESNEYGLVVESCDECNHKLPDAIKVTDFDVEQLPEAKAELRRTEGLITINPSGLPRNRWLVIQINDDPKDTHAVEWDGDLEVAMSEAIELANPDPKDSIAYGIVIAGDGGAARLQQPRGGWKMYKRAGTPRDNPHNLRYPLVCAKCGRACRRVDLGRIGVVIKDAHESERCPKGGEHVTSRGGMPIDDVPPKRNPRSR